MGPFTPNKHAHIAGLELRKWACVLLKRQKVGVMLSEGGNVKNALIFVLSMIGVDGGA